MIYRPVANLPFVSKVLEKVVALQLTNHMTTFKLHEPFQSAYKRHHGTETALTRIHNDIWKNMDEGKVSILVFLDLSAAFDTLNHEILLHRLRTHVGVSQNTSDWFSSYLRDRLQRVLIRSSSSDGQSGSDVGAMSDTYALKYGVPQGSVLGPLLFNVYMLPLGDVIRHHGLSCHFYADDTQLYLSAQPTAGNIQQQVSVLETCCYDIKCWMATNFWKLNDDKTDLLIIGSHASLSKIPTAVVNIGNHNITAVSEVKSLGVIFDNKMNSNPTSKTSLAVQCITCTI